MTDKVFYSILGVILVGWIALFVLVVMGKMTTYGEVSTQLEKRVKSMESYARQSPEELPTEALVTKKERFYEEWERNVLSAREFYERREERVTGNIPTDEAIWTARYRDAYQTLADQYRRSAGLGDEEALPFDEAQLVFNEETPIAYYEKAWRVQKLLVEQVLAAGGKIREYKAENPRNRKSINKDDPRPNFELDKVTVKATLPASRLSDLMAEVLGHPDLALELASLVVGKDPKALIGDVIQPKDEAITEEPPVEVAMAWHVLTWKPAEDDPEDD